MTERLLHWLTERERVPSRKNTTSHLVQWFITWCVFLFKVTPTQTDNRKISLGPLVYRAVCLTHFPSRSFFLFKAKDGKNRLGRLNCLPLVLDSESLLRHCVNKGCHGEDKLPVLLLTNLKGRQISLLFPKVGQFHCLFSISFSVSINFNYFLFVSCFLGYSLIQHLLSLSLKSV